MPVDLASPLRLGAVSFVNTLPLIDGLEGLRDVEVRCSVPSLLLDQLLAGEVEAALCSSIDYQRSPEPLVLLPAGLLGCRGPTLTVRLYSTVPIERLERVYCDTDSHTSIALMQILLAEDAGLRPELIPYDAREHVAENRPVAWPEAMLLIGDKVVTDSPPAVRYPHQVDLGDLWHRRTGRPFVFAAWMARATTDPARLALAAAVLDRQRRHNRERIDSMIHRVAVPRGWPADLALDYLTGHILYEFDDEAVVALELFHRKAVEHGLLESARPVDVLAEIPVG
ncbi:MAG: menaquinone biosynthetic enzyme MqnA/MqnD family protein [Planctomycetota bacterium]|jgi:chorismate dehydratase